MALRAAAIPTVKAETADAPGRNDRCRRAYLALSFPHRLHWENTVITVDGADVTICYSVTDDGSVDRQAPFVAQPGSVIPDQRQRQNSDLGTKVDGAVYTVTIICRTILSSMVRWQFGITIDELRCQGATSAPKPGLPSAPRHPESTSELSLISTELGQDVCHHVQLHFGCGQQWFDHITVFRRQSEGFRTAGGYDQYKGTWIIIWNLPRVRQIIPATQLLP